MNKYLVVGAGMQGVAIAYDLLTFHRQAEVVLADSDAACLAGAADFLAKNLDVECRRLVLDAGDAPARLKQVFSSFSTVISAVPYFFNPGLTEAAVAAGCHMVDLGGNTQVVLSQHQFHEQARAAGVTIVPDCGLMPGMGNNLAAMAIAEEEGNDLVVEIYCGGLPVNPDGPLNYKVVFSALGLLNEYSGLAHVIRNHEVQEVPTLEEIESVHIPGLGLLEAFTTSGGSSTAPLTLRKRVRDYTYKTLRYPGHCAAIKLLRDLGLLDKKPITVAGRQLIPAEIMAHLLQEKLAYPDEKDLVVLLVRVRNDGKTREITLIDRGDQSGLGAMQRSTGFPAAIVAAMISAPEVPRGVLYQEIDLDNNAFYSELCRRSFLITDQIKVNS